MDVKLNDYIRVIRGRRRGAEGYVRKETETAIGFGDLSRYREPLTWIDRSRLATDVEVVDQQEGAMMARWVRRIERERL